MERVKDYVFLHLCVMVFSFTGVCSKFASQAFNEGGILAPKLYLFLFLMVLDCVVYAFFWQKIIKRFDLNLGYANRSVYLLWSQLWAVAIFGEHLSLRNIIGMFVVLIGVIVVSLNAKQEEE